MISYSFFCRLCQTNQSNNRYDEVFFVVYLRDISVDWRYWGDEYYDRISHRKNKRNLNQKGDLSIK